MHNQLDHGVHACYSKTFKPVKGIYYTFILCFIRGAKLCVVKTKRKVQQVEAMTATHVITRKYILTFWY